MVQLTDLGRALCSHIERFEDDARLVCPRFQEAEIVRPIMQTRCGTGKQHGSAGAVRLLPFDTPARSYLFGERQHRPASRRLCLGLLAQAFERGIVVCREGTKLAAQGDELGVNAVRQGPQPWQCKTNPDENRAQTEQNPRTAGDGNVAVHSVKTPLTVKAPVSRGAVAGNTVQRLPPSRLRHCSHAAVAPGATWPLRVKRP